MDKDSTQEVRRWRVRFAHDCGARQDVVLDGMTEEMVRDWADLTVGRSRFFVRPIDGEPGPVGRCSTCRKRGIGFVIEAVPAPAEADDEWTAHCGRVGLDVRQTAGQPCVECGDEYGHRDPPDRPDLDTRPGAGEDGDDG